MYRSLIQGGARDDRCCHTGNRRYSSRTCRCVWAIWQPLCCPVALRYLSGKGRGPRWDKGLDGAVCHADYRQAIDRPELELVSICLPPSAHAETAIFALEAGKHVLLEKPMAPSLDECDAILAAAARSGARLSVVSQNRFQTSMFRLKRALDSGLGGEGPPRCCQFILVARPNYYDLWWRGTWEKEGGGCTLNHAVHHVDLLCG